MNPKNSNNLDPKLREAYDRIMGTTITPHPQAPVQPAAPAAPSGLDPVGTQPQAPANPPLMQSEQVFTPVQPTGLPPAQNAPALQQPVGDSTLSQAFTPQSSGGGSSLFAASPTSNPTVKKKLNLLPVILIVGGLIFFAVYGVVWAKVFGLF